MTVGHTGYQLMNMHRKTYNDKDIPRFFLQLFRKTVAVLKKCNYLAMVLRPGRFGGLDDSLDWTEAI